jgi:hypothetical protein
MSSLPRYLLSLPERVLRSATGLTAGLLRELSDVAIPRSVRRTRLYFNLVDSTLRFLIEQVGEVEGAYPADTKLAEDFALRRAAGNGIEMVGILAFRASPVWVMAALADLSGAGRHLVREIARELQRNQLLEPDTTFETVDQILNGLEDFSARTATTINTPPLDVGELRKEWNALRQDAARIPTPAIGSLEEFWRELSEEARRQQRSIFVVSSVMTLAALATLPERLLWLSRSATVAARHTGVLLGDALLSHYRATLGAIHQEGLLAYWTRQYKPYLKAAARQFALQRRSATERFFERL